MITNYGLELMGFVPIPKGTAIEAQFVSLNIYEVKGINLTKATKTSQTAPITTKVQVFENLSLVFGTSVNKCCKAIIGDIFTDDEAKWMSETKSKPPYLLVVTKSPDKAVCSKGYWKDEEQSIITHDCFTSAKQLLQKEESTKTSVLITSLSVSLSSFDQFVTFVPVCREVFAETNLGKTLRDYQITLAADITTSRGSSSHQLANKVKQAVEKYHQFHPKVGYFFDLASKEKDKLKAFIYYFLVIEIFTHQTFQLLNHDLVVAKLHIIPERVKGSATDLLIERQKECKNLTQRFIFCSLAKWYEVNDKDIDTFKLVKKSRDRIYHGEEISEKALPLKQAQALALKLLHSLFNAGHNKKAKVEKVKGKKS